MATRFGKTALGHREIREPSHGLPRNARLLLVLSDGQRTVAELKTLVKGASADDIALLLHKGLIDDIDANVLDRAARSNRDTADSSLPVISDATPDAPLAESAAGLGFNELYDSLNALAKEQLGLFKGFRFSLEIERATGIDAMREVAQRFVVEVHKAKGVSAAQMVRRALSLQG